MQVTYVAFVLDSSDDSAFGVVFPDLPGCFSAGDTLAEAERSAREALSLYCEVALERGQSLPPPRSLEAVAGDKDLQVEFGGTLAKFIAVSAEVAEPGAYRQSEPGHEAGGFRESE